MKTKQTMKIKKFETPLYQIEFTCVIYENPEEAEEYFKDSEASGILSDFGGAVFNHKDHLYIVFYANEKGCPEAGLIAHESKHLVNNIFITIRHKLDRHNDEPECYLLAWIVDRIHEMKKEFEKTLND
jgi:uncharacterized protein YlbG (UPF0298 family)